MEFNLTEEGPYVYSISVLPEGGSLLSVLEVHKHQLCSDALLKGQNLTNVQTENSDAYSLCVVDIGSAKDNAKTTESNEDYVGNLRSEGLVNHLQKVFWQRQQESLKMGGKVLQLLLNLGLILLKLASRGRLTTERVDDMPNNRRRRNKRAAFFDSRRVVLTFSILSIYGTLILIYLTLRVGQTAATI